MKKLFLIDPNQRKIPTDSGKWLNVNYDVGFKEMKKLLRILVLGLLKSYPIDYGRTSTRPANREIKS